LEIDSKYVHAWNNKGNALYELGKYNEAIKCYDKAIEIAPKNSDALMMKGMALNYLGVYDEAIECAEKFIEIEGDHAKALALKGEALGYKGRYKEAIECAKKAIEIDNNNDYAWFVKGYAVDYSGDHDTALTCFDKAIEIDPNNADALNGKGIALNYKNRYNEAENYFNVAIRLREKKGKYQDTAYSYLNKSVSLYNLKRDEEEVFDCLAIAKSKSDEAILRNQNDVHAWMIKGASCFKLGLYDMAILCFNKIIIDLNREFDHAWCLKGYVLNYLERYQEALYYFDEALIMNPEDSDYYIGRGISLYALEKYEEAIKCFDKAAHKERAYKDIVFFLKGVSNYGNQFYIEALDDFKEVGCDVNLDGQKHISIGACYYRIGLVEEARNEYYAAIKSNPKLAEAYYNLGGIK
jgi:tetratricopeptide (TPR) repeat protein